MAVELSVTRLPGVLVITSPLFRDNRGYFMESFSARDFENAGFPPVTFVQDNLSCSVKGALRGMHYQLEPHAMGKLVRVIQGAVFDVVVDLRTGSPAFGQWAGEHLAEGDGKALWVPGGFAHGFLALEDDTLVHYKCDAFHEPAAERSLHYADPSVGIVWPAEVRVISPKDEAAPRLRDAEHNFTWQPSMTLEVTSEG